VGSKGPKERTAQKGISELACHEFTPAITTNTKPITTAPLQSNEDQQAKQKPVKPTQFKEKGNTKPACMVSTQYKKQKQHD
jgi:hypothetical protein